MKKQLPIGINSFEKIISNNCVYIDKTHFVYELANHFGYYFLSRPRRFGKSLLLDTFKCLFEGKKELFKGLYIYDKWNWNKKFPVIKIDFASGDYQSTNELINKIFKTLKDNYFYHEIPYDQSVSYNIDFQTLIQEVHKKYQQRVVILIDEYDKPILDCITDIQTAIKHRDILRNLYSVIKGSDEILQFAFLTGVFKFSKMSVFSTLNNLTDISITRAYADICGYTHEDILNSFQDYLEGVDIEKMQRWYNGYCWHVKKPKVYNPFDVLLFLQNQEYQNYWFESGTPSFLVKLIKEKNYYLPDIENIKVSDNFLVKFDIENLNIISLLWQTGYLTIKKQYEIYDVISYELGYPNYEVEYSLNEYLFGEYVPEFTEYNTIAFQTKMSLTQINIEELQKQLYSLFAGIGYSVSQHIKDYEGFYGSVLYAFFKGLGLNCILEDNTNKGRIDLSILIKEAIYIFEFKVKRLGNESALEQIKSKRYYEKYLNEGKPIYLVGVIFDVESKNITTIEWERM